MGAIVRFPNDTLNFPQAPVFSGYNLTHPFGNLSFENPVALASPPGETNRLFVVERHGKIMVITNLAAPTKTLFLDLRFRLRSNNIESGLLGLAFHPGYATNGYFYVYRTLWPVSSQGLSEYHDRLSRFETDPQDPNRVLPGSELV
jgi:hypothetical protein